MARLVVWLWYHLHLHVVKSEVEVDLDGVSEGNQAQNLLDQAFHM